MDQIDPIDTRGLSIEDRFGVTCTPWAEEDGKGGWIGHMQHWPEVTGYGPTKDDAIKDVISKLEDFTRST